MTVYKIEELKEEKKELELKAKILSLNQRETKSERGEGVYFYGLLGDETGTMPFTAWAFPATVRAGDVVELKNCTTKEYNGRIRIYVDSKSEVVLRTDETIEVKRSYKDYKVKDLSTKDMFVAVEGKLSEIMSKDFEKEGTVTKIYYGTLEDDTGKVRISSFGKPLESNRTVRIEGAKVSEYNGRLRLTINDKANVSDSTLVVTDTEKPLQISEATSPVGGITIRGFAITLGDKSGLRMRCSECRKTLEDIHCPDHPTAPYYYDLFAYFTVSDGSGYVQCTAGSAPLLPAIGMSESDLDVNNSSLMKKDVFNRMKDAIFGKPLVITGDLVNGQMGMSLRATSIRPLSAEDVKSAIKEMEVELQ